MLSLGPAADTEKLIAEWREEWPGEAFSPVGLQQKPIACFERRASDFGRRFGIPCRYVKGASRIFIVPDGAVSLVPFAALPKDESGYLLEQAPPFITSPPNATSHRQRSATAGHAGFWHSAEPHLMQLAASRRAGP